MVVANLDIIGIPVNKSEAKAPLVVNGNCMPPFSIAFQSMKSVSRWNFQVIQLHRQIDIL